MAFRDETAAAHARVEALELENARLKSAIERLQQPSVNTQRRRTMLVVGACVATICGLTVVALRQVTRHTSNSAGASKEEERSAHKLATWKPLSTCTVGMNAVWADGMTVITVGDHGVICQLTEGHPVQVPSSVTVALRGIAQVTPNTLVVVGDSGTALRFDALERRWRVEPTGTTSDLHSITMVGAEAWAVGAHGTLVRRIPDGTWRTVALGRSTNLYAITHTQDGTLWIAGGEGTILRVSVATDGTVNATAQMSGTAMTLYTIAVDDSGGILAAGANGTLLRLLPEAPTGWTTIATPTTKTLRSMVGVTVQNFPSREGLPESVGTSLVVMAGDDATMLTYDPYSHVFEIPAPVPTDEFRALTTSAQRIFVAGSTLQSIDLLDMGGSGKH